MRRTAGLIVLLVSLVACSESRSVSRVVNPGDLTPENASLVATVAANAPDEQVRDLLGTIGGGDFGVEAAGYRSPPVFLLLFRPDATTQQRRAAFARLAQTGYFNSIQCSSCSSHTPQPNPPGSR